MDREKKRRLGKLIVAIYTKGWGRERVRTNWAPFVEKLTNILGGETPAGHRVKSERRGVQPYKIT